MRKCGALGSARALGRGFKIYLAPSFVFYHYVFLLVFFVTFLYAVRLIRLRYCGRVLIANADMAVLRGDIDSALSILKSITPSQQ